MRSVSHVDLMNGQIETISQVNASDQFYDPTAPTSQINQIPKSAGIYHEELQQITVSDTKLKPKVSSIALKQHMSSFDGDRLPDPESHR